MANLQFNDLAWELHKLLDIPCDARRSKGGYYYQEPALGRTIIRTIIKSMISALQRGESVHIRGFGTFEVVENKHNKINHYAIVSGSPLVFSPVPVKNRKSKKVIFRPSTLLEAMVNQEAPNYRQRRAMKRWLSNTQ